MSHAAKYVLNKLTLSSQMMMMNFSRQVVQYNAYILMGNVASHCYVSSAFANTFGLKIKKGINTMVLGNCDQVPIGGHIKVHVKIQQYYS